MSPVLTIVKRLSRRWTVGSFRQNQGDFVLDGSFVHVNLHSHDYEARQDHRPVNGRVGLDALEQGDDSHLHQDAKPDTQADEREPTVPDDLWHTEAILVMASVTTGCCGCCCGCCHFSNSLWSVGEGERSGLAVHYYNARAFPWCCLAKFHL